MKISRLTITLLFLSSALMFSCKKNSDTTDSDTSGAQDNALAENTSNDIVSIASQASDGGSLVTGRLGGGSGDNPLSCASVVRDTAAKTVTVTFNGSTCFDGRTRSGSLTFNFSGSPANSIYYRDPGFKCVVTANGYTVDGNVITINNKSIENTTNNGVAAGYNPATMNETWHIQANISIAKANNAGTVSWICDRTKTLLNSSTTCPAADFVNFPTSDNTAIDWKNARVGITGSASGTRSNGETFTVTVTSQLVRDFGSCNISGRHPFILGTLDFAPGTKPVRHVDYGYSPSPNQSGSCDDWMSVTINSHTYYVRH